MSKRQRKKETPMSALAPPPGGTEVADRLIDARLHLLDRQVMDRDLVPVTTVDDLEISDVPDGPLDVGTPPPRIVALLSGSFRFTRILGGRPPISKLDRIAWSDVAQVGTALRLRVGHESLDVGWLERWVAQHVVGRIPGGHHDSE